MQKRGVLSIPGQASNWYVSTAHTEQDIDDTIGKAGEAMEEFKDRLR
jgi:glutamate-1-semialdehyde aminotransferase